jgi:predicted KAP-like P-loop ATPase
LIAFIKHSDSSTALEAAIRRGTQDKQPDGTSSARKLLDQLGDHLEQLSDDQVVVFVTVLLDVGDSLLIESDQLGAFDAPNEIRIALLLKNLLNHVDKAKRYTVLEQAIALGHAIHVQRALMRRLSHELTDKGNGGATLQDEQLKLLKTIWVQKVVQDTSALLASPMLRQLLWDCSNWGNANEAKKWCQKVIETDEGLLTFINGFSSYTTYTMSKSVRRQPRLNPQWLEPYIDTNECERRLSKLLKTETVTDAEKEAVEQYLKEFEVLAAGGDLETTFDFHDPN